MREKIVYLLALSVQVGAYYESEGIHAILFGGKVCDFTDTNIFKGKKLGGCEAHQKQNSESSYNK